MVLAKPSTAPILVGALFVFLALFMGLAASVLPVHIFVALLALPALMVASAFFPLSSMVLALFVCFGALPSLMLPQFPLAGGTVRASELFLAGIGIVFAFHAIATRGKFVHLLSSPYTKLFVFFAGLVVISSITAQYTRTPLKYYLYELRTCLYWALFFLLLYAIRSRDSLFKFLIALAVVGFVIALGVIVQYFTGITVLDAGKVEQLGTAGAVYSDIKRSFAGGGIYVVAFCLNFVTCLWGYKRINVMTAAPIIAICLFAILVTFGRAVWAGVFLAFIAILLLSKMAPRLKIGLSATTALFVGVAVMAVAAPALFDAMADRVTSVEREVQSSESYDWRRSENEYAVKKIADNPLFGVGLGGIYQPSRNPFMSEEHVRVIHSAYYYLVLKFGILGILIPIWFAVSSWNLWKRMKKQGYSSPNAEPVIIAIVASTTTPYLTSFTQPEWMHYTGVAFFSCMFASLTLVSRYWANLEKPVSKPEASI